VGFLGKGSPISYRVWGSAISSPSGVPAAQAFLAFYRRRMAFPGIFFSTFQEGVEPVNLPPPPLNTVLGNSAAVER